MSVRKDKGFTVMELMVVLTIAAMVMAFAIPQIQTLQRKTRMNALAEDLSASLAAARALAITQRRQVFLVALPAASATPTSWEIHADTAAGTLMEQHQVTAPVTLQLIPCATCGAAPVSQIHFLPNGVVQRADTNASLTMTYRICASDSTTEVGRDVGMNQLGRLFSTQHTSSAVCNP